MSFYKKKRGAGKSKKESQRIHAVRRAKQRYKIDINGKFLYELAEKIQNNEAKLISKRSNKTGVWLVEHLGETFKVVTIIHVKR